METYKNPIKERETSDAVSFICANAFGQPIVFSAEPSLSDLKANSWGKYDTAIYIKFANGTGLKITGTVLS